jgi:hypothetical protein
VSAEQAQAKVMQARDRWLDFSMIPHDQPVLCSFRTLSTSIASPCFRICRSPHWKCFLNPQQRSDTIGSRTS